MKVKIINFLIIFLILIFVLSFINKVEAIEVLGPMSGLLNPDPPEDISNIGGIINTAIGFIQIVGTGISVIMVSVLGIKYMLAAPSDKAEVKKQIAPLVIGAVILFVSVNIIQIISDFSSTLPTGYDGSTSGSETHTSSSDATHGGSGGGF